MKIITPNYYQNFKCIAAECKHNCCIGWEIDVDCDTLAYYRSLSGEIGQRLKKSIACDETPHFILDEQERCPFLNDCNLCDLITALGEDALCDICADHPRFRNEFGNRTELGLGLCCEAAAKLILGQTERTVFTTADQQVLTEDEKAFLAKREEIYSILQDRSLPLTERLKKVEATYCNQYKEIHPREWAPLFWELERMDPSWEAYLEKLEDRPMTRWELPLEKAAVYFTYRHLAGALEDDRFTARLRFVLLSVRVLSSLAERAETFEEVAEIARLYSAEIEYSDQNVDLLLDHLS